MKKVLLLLLIAPVLGFGQGVQRYADGTATDQDGNTFEWINYDTQDWAIENAEVVTYRDGTPIPQVTDNSEWKNLLEIGGMTNGYGAWCYYNNDPTKGKLYNWYAVMGIHDNDANTPNKEFAPEGWHVPTYDECITFENYLIANGYNYDGTGITAGDKIAKAMASTTGWVGSTVTGAVGNNQSLNNRSGFNLLPIGSRGYGFANEGFAIGFWTSSQSQSLPSMGYSHLIYLNRPDLTAASQYKYVGNTVRFVRDASTASTTNYSNAITIYPNPTTSILTIDGNKEYQIKVYDLLGNKVLETQGNSVNMEHLSTATYIVKATDKSNNEELTYKVVKK